jgi:hypothetical protein
MKRSAVAVLSSLWLAALSVGCAPELPGEADDSAAREREAWRLSRDLKGYAALRQSFDLDTAHLGLIGMFPASLHVGLRTWNPSRLPDAVWWWNPLDEEGRPTYDWDAFLQAYREAAHALTRHPWLREWRHASRGRLVELHAFGTEIGETAADLDAYVLPVWRDAGLAGRPGYSLLLRRGDREWATLYIGTEEARALVTSVSHPEKSPAHWLDGLDVYYHPRCTPNERSSRYVVVQPTGQGEVHTVRTCQP